MPGYSFIICTYNRANYLRETIQSILTNIDEKYDYEILVINNNSPDNTANVVQEFSYSPLVKYFLETNQGLSHARNRGIKEANKPVLVFLDDDIDIEKNYLAQCKQIFLNPEVHIVGGKVLPYGVQVPEWLPRQYDYIISIFDLGEEPHFTDKLMGANYAMRKEAAQEIGWYNVELGRKGSNLMGGEEVDYLDRAGKLGYKVMYHPGMVVYHKIGNKINTDYVYSYSTQIGTSEAIIDLQNSKLKFIIKIFKAFVMIGLYFLYGFYAPVPKHRVYFTINKLYSVGYLKEAFILIFKGSG